MEARPPVDAYGLPVDLVASHDGIFMVPCSLRCLCMSNAFQLSNKVSMVR